MIACQYCGGLETFIIAAIIAAWGWGCYMLTHIFSWLRSIKPKCPSCNCFISCSLAQVKKCPKQKPWYRRW